MAHILVTNDDDMYIITRTLHEFRARSITDGGGMLTIPTTNWLAVSNGAIDILHALEIHDACPHNDPTIGPANTESTPCP